MNQNQLNKFKGRLLNIQTQLGGASLCLGNDPTEQRINHRICQALALIKEASALTEDIKPVEPPKIKPKKHKIPDYPMTETVIIRRDPTVKPTYNLLCRNYTEVRNSSGKVIERGCIVGMDMDYCSKNCAYATNNVCSLRG